MIQKADITAYLPGNLANKEPELIRHYVQIYIMAAAGPMADLVTDENKVFEEPHVHDENCGHEHKEEGTGFRITPKKEEEKKEAPKQHEKKQAVEEDDDYDPFDYSDDSIESDQTVQLPEERY
jgi:hypothetical protein